MERYKSIILGEDVIFAITNNTSVDICWYLAYLDICAPWLEEGGGLVDYTADEQTDICPDTTLYNAPLKYTNKQTE